MGELTIFVGGSCEIASIKATLDRYIEHVDYTQDDFTAVSCEVRQDIGGEGKIILHTLDRVWVKAFRQRPRAVMFIDDFIGRIDEAVDVREHIRPLLEIGDVFFFAESDDNIHRLGELTTRVHRLTKNGGAEEPQPTETERRESDIGQPTEPTPEADRPTKNGCAEKSEATEAERRERCKNGEAKPHLTPPFGQKIKLDRSNLVAICARPGLGKTALALDLALDFARDTGRGVYVFSFEMMGEGIYDRLVAKLTGISPRRLRERTLTPEEKLAAGEATSEIIERLGIRVSDDIYRGADAMIAEVQSAHDIGLVIVDYLGLMSQPTDISSNDKARAVMELKSMSRRLGIPVIFTHQLSRRAEGVFPGRKPRLSDVESYIARAADTALLIYRESYYREVAEERADEAEIILAKNAYGAIDTWRASWCGEQMSFRPRKTK